MIYVCIAIFLAGVYLGWRGGSMATEERYAQAEQNRLDLEAAKIKLQKSVEAQIRTEDTERKKALKVISDQAKIDAKKGAQK